MLPDQTASSEPLPPPPVPSPAGYELHLYFTAATFQELAQVLLAVAQQSAYSLHPTVQLRLADLTPLETE